MNLKKDIYMDGLEKFSVSWILGQNLFLICYFILGFLGMYPVQVYKIPILSLLLLLWIIVVLVFMLRKHLCTNCYYYNKLCHLGWGKISGHLFAKNSGNYNFGGKLAGITWMFVLTFFPIIGIGFVVIWKWFSFYYTVIFFSFIVMSALNFFIQKKSCEKCKMRFICPGSLAKAKN